MKSILTIVCLGLALVSLGCSGGPEVRERGSAPRSTTYNAGFEKTWSAVIDVLTENKMAIKAIEKDSGIVTTEFLVSGPRFAYFGKKDEGKEYSVMVKKTRYSLSVRAKALAGGKTLVSATPVLEYMVYDEDDVPVRWAPCETDGDIEKSFYSDLKAALGS